MRWLLCALVVLAGCDSLKNVPCDQCAKYGAVCDPKTKTCQRGLVLDMAVVVEPDMRKGSVGDMALQDGPPPPMCTPASDISDCTDASKPVCGSDGKCRACNGSADNAVCLARSMATPYCATGGPNAGKCVQCTTATQMTDCPASAPICGADGACRKCEAHAECPNLGMWPASSGTTNIPATTIPGICVLEDFTAGTPATTYAAGSCAPSGQVAFVDNRGSSVMTCGMGGTHDGTSAAKAYCDVQTAVMASKPFVVVAGRASANPYGGASTGGMNVNISRSVSIVGPGVQRFSNAPPATAVISSNGGTDCVTVSGNATVILDGFEVTTTTSKNLNCNAGAATTALVARRNYLHTALNLGVESNNCTITLDGNYIESNTGGGVRLTGSVYTVTNNMITLNGSQAGPSYGVRIDDSPAASVFAFNTVAGNQSGATSAPGIVCNAAATIQASIVAANTTPTAGATQFSGSCTLMNVITGVDPANSNPNAPAFIGPPNYHLDITTPSGKQENEMYLINQLGAPGTPNSDHDVDFTPRPKGPGPKNYDIGAQEAE
jgi:hypothetical protein